MSTFFGILSGLLWAGGIIGLIGASSAVGQVIAMILLVIASIFMVGAAILREIKYTKR